MSDESSATSKTLSHCCSRSAWCAIIALVFLRLCVGFHFFSEGSKKVAYDRGRNEWKLVFSSAGFLSQAKGPLAGFFQNQLPSGHGWQSLLRQPKQLTPDSLAELSDWVSKYVKRRQQELKSGKHTLAETPDFVPYAQWQKRIVDDWRATQKRFTDLSELDETQREQAAELFERREMQLADFLAESALDIQAYQHELWRLNNQRALPGASEVPFEQERVAEKSAELAREPRKWAGAVKKFDAAFVQDLRSVLNDEQRNSDMAEQVDQALTTPKEKKLARMDLAVTVLIIGVGICLMAGFLTRLASIGGALFLLSVMATQPPWIPESMTDFFYYQLVEFAALLLLATVGAGRWAGLDAIFYGLCSKCCGKKAR